jgi:RecA/RadA recombinase
MAKDKDVMNVINAELIAELEKVAKIQSISLSTESRMSTGLLCLDLILGSGLTSGMYTIAGPEQSAKTTTAIAILAASTSQDVGMRVLWDAENSSGSSMDYVSNVFNTQGVKADMESLFGQRDNKTGKYTKMPLIYYRDEGEMDTYFDWVAALLRRLPDKRFQAGQWWLIYENNQDNKAKYKGQYDAKMSSANNALYIPAPDAALQAIILVDSYPSLMPASMDEDDVKVGMALQAREFSKHLPRIKGKLRSKRVAVIGINQIREKIGFVMGDPRYEPGGNSLKFLSDVRLWNTPRALSSVPFNPKGKGQIEKEPSILDGGGEDTYRYIHVKAIKNKLSVPGRETWLRLWVEDAESQAHGFCPVWDTFYAMVLTGQITGKRHTILLDVHGLGKAKKTINWAEFKKLILGTKEEISAVCKKLGYKPMNLRKGMFNLSRKGKLEELYSKTHRASTGGKAEPEPDEDEDEDDDE